MSKNIFESYLPNWYGFLFLIVCSLLGYNNTYSPYSLNFKSLAICVTEQGGLYRTWS